MGNNAALQSDKTVDSFEVWDAYRQPVEIHENSDPPQGATLRAIRDLVEDSVPVRPVRESEPWPIPAGRMYEVPYVAQAFDRNGVDVNMYEIEDLPREAVLQAILETLQRGIKVHNVNQ